MAKVQKFYGDGLEITRSRETGETTIKMDRRLTGALGALLSHAGEGLAPFLFELRSVLDTMVVGSPGNGPGRRDITLEEVGE
jgi:hypothetical protein